MSFFFPQEVNSWHLSDLFLHFILSYPEVPRPGHLTIYSKAPETFCKEKGCRESGRHMQTVFQRQGLLCSSLRLPLYLISCPPLAPKQRNSTWQRGKDSVFRPEDPQRPKTSPRYFCFPRLNTSNTPERACRSHKTISDFSKQRTDAKSSQAFRQVP